MRAPDHIIGGADDPYLLRWWMIPRNRVFNIYLHKFLRSDDDRALHDHPWPSVSIILRGGYREHFHGGFADRRPGAVVFRRATTAHRVELRNGPAWSLFVTGPRIRSWGFHCPQGWRHWQEFTSGPNGETVGKGCD
jgi:hypothetical protein